MSHSDKSTLQRWVVMLLAILVPAFVVTGCGSGGGSGGVLAGAGVILGEITVTEIEVAGAGTEAPANGDAVPVLGFNLAASGNNIDVETITFQLTAASLASGVDPVNEIAGAYLVLDGNNSGAIELTKSLFVPNPVFPDTIIGDSPRTFDASGTVTFTLAGGGERIIDGQNENWFVLLDLNGADPIDPGDVLILEFVRLGGETEGGGNIDFDETGTIVTGDGTTGTGVKVTGALVLANGTAHNNGNTTSQDGATLTDVGWQLNLSATGENIFVNSIKLTNTGTVTLDTDTTAASWKLVLDVNGDGVVDVGDTTIKTGATVAGNTATFSGLDEQIVVGVPQNWIVEVPLSGAADGGETLILSVANDTDVTAKNAAAGAGDDVFTSTDILTPGASTTIIGSFVTAVANNPASPAQVSGLSTDQLILGFAVTPADEGVQFNTITLTPSGTGDDVNTLLAVDAVKIYKDDGDNIFEPTGGSPDTQVGVGVFSADNTATVFTLATAPTSGQATQFWVAYSFRSNAAETQGNQFIVALDVSATAAVGLGSGQAMVDGNATDLAGSTLEINPVATLSLATDATFGTAYFTQDNQANQLLQGFTVAVDFGTVTFDSVTIKDQLATFADGNFAAATGQLYRDGANATYDAGGADDTPLGAASTIAVAGTTLGGNLSETVTAGAPRTYWIDGDLVSSARVAGDAFRFDIAANTDLVLAAGSSNSGVTGAAVAGPAATVRGFYVTALANGTLPDATVFANTTNNGALGFTVTPTDEAVNINQVTIIRNGTGADADIINITVYQDGGNGTFDAGAGDDTSVGTGVIGAIGLSGATAALGGAQQFWVAVDFNNLGNAALTYILDLDVSVNTVAVLSALNTPTPTCVSGLPPVGSNILSPSSL